MSQNWIRSLLTLLAVVVPGVAAVAAGGIKVIATKGNMSYVSQSLPTGTGVLINHPSRTIGWNSWFTEWPSDVNHYAFDIKSTDDINALAKKLAAIKAETICVRLCHAKEPSALGYSSALSEGNGIGAVFSVGSQQAVNRWYKHVRKPFGYMDFIDVPVAVPPTLTVYVRNPAVDLKQLHIPTEIEVTFGALPDAFYKWNTVLEKLGETPEGEEKRQDYLKRWKQELTPEARDAVKQIEAYIDNRE